MRCKNVWRWENRTSQEGSVCLLDLIACPHKGKPELRQGRPAATTSGLFWRQRCESKLSEQGHEQWTLPATEEFTHRKSKKQTRKLKEKGQFWCKRNCGHDIPITEIHNDDFGLCLMSWASYKLIFGDHALFLTLPLSLLPVRNEEQLQAWGLFIWTYQQICSLRTYPLRKVLEKGVGCLGALWVCLGCHNKRPQAARHKQWKCASMVLEAGSPRSRCLPGQPLAGLSPSQEVTAFLMCPHMADREQEREGYHPLPTRPEFYWIRAPIMTSFNINHCLSNPHLQTQSHWG